MTADVLVIGNGMAGTAAALYLAQLAPHLHIVLAGRSGWQHSASAHAQGGLAAPLRLPDNVEQHILDTLAAGAHRNDPLAVRTIITEAVARMDDLVHWGVPFHRDRTGRLALHREGGHRYRRVAHTGDETGLHLMAALHQRLHEAPQVHRLAGFTAAGLLKDGNGKCCGAWGLHRGKVLHIDAKHTVLATGGIGALYPSTTNPAGSTGSGIAMAALAGAETADMAFVQFHPTAWYCRGGRQSVLVTEAVRGEGAVLRNHAGDDFMRSVHPLGSLAPRDVVSRAIFSEMQRSGKPHVWLDLGPVPETVLRLQFPALWSRLKEMKPPGNMVPVAPAAHYLCGGIRTTLDAESTVPGLYAIGECAHTGLHGANRLASNSLLENVVMAHRCAAHIAVCKHTKQPDTLAKPLPLPLPELNRIQGRIRQLIGRYMHVVRTTDGMEFAAGQLAAIPISDSLRPDRPYDVAGAHMLLCARLMVADGLAQRENAGTFFNRDFGDVHP